MEYCKRLGFKKYKFLENDGAQCHIIENPTNFIIAFRGTEPKQFSDIAADLKGFRDAAVTIMQIIDTQMKTSRNVVQAQTLQYPLEHTVHVTGHSLGGAMATIAASRLEEQTKACSIHVRIATSR